MSFFGQVQTFVFGNAYNDMSNWLDFRLEPHHLWSAKMQKKLLVPKIIRPQILTSRPCPLSASFVACNSAPSTFSSSIPWKLWQTICCMGAQMPQWHLKKYNYNWRFSSTYVSTIVIVCSRRSSGEFHCNKFHKLLFVTLPLEIQFCFLRKEIAY